MNLPFFGPDISLGITLPFFIELSFGGVAFGLALDIQPPLADGKPLATHVRNTLFYFFVVFASFVAFMHIFDEHILPPAYLERYSMSQTVVEATAYSIVGIGLCTLHWVLKRSKKE